MSKEFYDKYGKLVDCCSCNCIEPCSKSDSPLCSEGYVFFAKDKIADLETKLAKSEEQRQHLKNWLDNEILTSVDHESYYATINEYEEETKKLKQQLADMEQEQIAEMKEHQDAMELADKTIKNLIEDNRASQEWYKKQLAESESRFQAHKQNDARIIQDQTDLIENLKQQVKEKEKQLAEYSDINNALNSGLKDRCISCEEEHNQDKISFAVEQLTEIRDYVKNCWSLDTTEGKVRLDIAKKIRLKIEELKGNENE